MTTPVLEVRDLVKAFPVGGGLFERLRFEKGRYWRRRRSCVQSTA